MFNPKVYSVTLNFQIKYLNFEMTKLNIKNHSRSVTSSFFTL